MSITATYVRQFGLDELTDPWGIAVDPSDGDVLVVNDSGGSPSLLRYAADGTPVTSTALSPLEAYSGVAANAAGTTLWVTNYYGGAVEPRLARRSATGTLQEALFVGSFPDVQIEGPTDVQVGPDGRVYVVSNYHASAGPVYKQAVVRLDEDGAVETTFGTNASLSGSPLAFPEPQVDGELAYPVGVAIDADGNVYVSDVHKPYRSIQKFNSAGDHLLTFGGPGDGDGQFSTSQFAITGWHQDGMKLAIGDGGLLFATDRYGQRVNVYALDGTPLGSFGTADSPNGELAYPVAVACGPGGNVYVTDYNGGVTQWLVEGSGFSVRGIRAVTCGDTDC